MSLASPQRELRPNHQSIGAVHAEAHTNASTEVVDPQRADARGNRAASTNTETNSCA